MIIARTDALQIHGYDIARDRLRAAISAGADVAFLEGVASEDQGRQICQDLSPTPVLFNCVPGGLSPEISVQQAKALGFKMIIFPGLFLGHVVVAATEAAVALQSSGTMTTEVAARNGSPKAIFEVCGLHECMKFDAEAGGKSFSKGV